MAPYPQPQCKRRRIVTRKYLIENLGTKTGREMALELGVTPGAVSRAAKRMRLRHLAKPLERKTRPPSPQTWADADVYALYEAGLSWKAIGKRLGITHTRLWHAYPDLRGNDSRTRWCPPAYRSDYKTMIRYHLRASEARQIIEEQIAQDRSRNSGRTPAQAYEARP